MKTLYSPRRASLTRWLKHAPAYVLDCIYDKPSDSYTVLLTGDFLLCRDDPYRASVQYLDVDTCGRACWGELKAHEAAAYRYRSSRSRRAWLALPDEVRSDVENRCNLA